MKRMTYFVMALALVLGFTQCKKEKIEPQNEGNVVRITLEVNGSASTGSSADGSRAQVDPPHVNFVNGDQILVAYDGKYVGTLENNGSKFEGEIEITPAQESQPLYFYFLGNNQGALETGATTCTVNISDQTKVNDMPVISMGKSYETYPSDDNSYSSKLYNKASLMKFNVTTPSTAAICITGMNNEVTVHFDNPTDSGFEYDMNETDGGLIRMPAKDANNETWAIVLPQTALDEGVEGSVYSEDNFYGVRPALDEIVVNTFLSNGVSITVKKANANINGGGNVSGWMNDGGNPWGGDAPGGDGGNNLGGWNNGDNNPWGN